MIEVLKITAVVLVVAFNIYGLVRVWYYSYKITKLLEAWTNEEEKQ